MDFLGVSSISPLNLCKESCPIQWLTIAPCAQFGTDVVDALFRQVRVALVFESIADREDLVRGPIGLEYIDLHVDGVDLDGGSQKAHTVSAFSVHLNGSVQDFIDEVELNLIFEKLFLSVGSCQVIVQVDSFALGIDDDGVQTRRVFVEELAGLWY